MHFSRSRLYTIVLTACLAGYIWLFYSLNFHQHFNGGICLIKRVTSIPCPSCGTTRSIILLCQGKIIASILINPFGFLVALAMMFLPVWIIFDLFTKKQTFLSFYRNTEDFLKNPKIAIPVILLVLLNWIWNITKGL